MPEESRQALQARFHIGASGHMHFEAFLRVPSPEANDLLK
jgi:hypothetical protein